LLRPRPARPILNMSRSNKPTHLRIMTNRRSGLCIVTCGTSQVCEILASLRKSTSKAAHAVIGDATRPLTEGYDFTCRLVRTFAPGTPPLEIKLAKNELIASLGNKCLTESNQKAAAEAERRSGVKRHTLFMVASRESPQYIFGLSSEGLMRFMINIRARGKKPDSVTHEFVFGKELLCRELVTVESEEHAKRALSRIQDDYARHGRLVGNKRIAWKSGTHVDAVGHDDAFKEIMRTARAAAERFEAELGRGQAAAAPEAEAAVATEPVIVHEIRMPESSQDALTEAALSRKRRREMAVIPHYAIYLFEHATLPVRHVVGTEDIEAYMDLARKRVVQPGCRTAVINEIIASQPEDYYPQLVEELHDVTATLANVRLQVRRQEMATVGVVTNAVETRPDHVRGPKLILLSAPGQRLAAVTLTIESLHEFKLRMRWRQRAVADGRDKDARNLRVVEEPDHTIEILEVLRPEDGKEAHLRARRAHADRLRSSGWTLVTDSPADGDDSMTNAVHSFYRILRTISTDLRCYVGRTTQVVRNRIALHTEKMATGDYASHQIMRDGQWTYEVLGAFRLPSTREANEIEARLIARYPQAVNLEFASRRANVIGTERDPYYGMDINDVAVALGGEVVTPIAPLAAAERTSE